MALMPKRVKHRKSQRGRIKGSETRGTTVVFGDYGIQSLEPGWIKATTIEAGRIAAQQYVRGEGKLYIRIFPDKSVTSTPLETRMGKGKGAPDFWAAVELREMSDDQLQATANEAAEQLFRLRFQSQSERLNTPSDIRKNRRLIARIKTIQTERSQAANSTTSEA